MKKITKRKKEVVKIEVKCVDAASFAEVVRKNSGAIISAVENGLDRKR